MLELDPSNPFPLIAEGVYTYREEQEYSARVDDWLGLDTHAVEATMSFQPKPDQNFWLNLPVHSLLTPYTEIRRILDIVSPQPGEIMIDLGAAYGRVAFVVARHYPGVTFIGYECVPERSDEANRCLTIHGISFEVITSDIAALSFQPIQADYFFMYDFGSRQAIDKALGDLRDIAKQKAITVIARGRASRDAIEKFNPWLSQVIAPCHFSHYSIYKSR